MSEKDPFDLDDLDLPGESTPPVPAQPSPQASEPMAPIAAPPVSVDPPLPAAAPTTDDTRSGHDLTWDAPMSASLALAQQKGAQETAMPPPAPVDDGDQLLNDEARQMLKDQAERAKQASKQAAKAGAAAAVVAGQKTAKGIQEIFADPKRRKQILAGVVGIVVLTAAVNIGMWLAKDEPAPAPVEPAAVSPEEAIEDVLEAPMEEPAIDEAIEPVAQPCVYRRLGQSRGNAREDCMPASEVQPEDVLEMAQPAPVEPEQARAPEPVREIQPPPAPVVRRPAPRPTPARSSTPTPSPTIGEREKQQLDAISAFGDALDEQ